MAISQPASSLDCRKTAGAYQCVLTYINRLQIWVVIAMANDAPNSERFDAYHKWLGIPPDEQPPDHYRLFGIQAFESDPDVIGSAAGRQMANVRSFQIGEHVTEATRLLNELSAARVCLLNPDDKWRYDENLKAERSPTPLIAVTKPSSTATPTAWPRQARRRKNPTLAVVKIILGGVAGIALALLILWYGFGRDPSGIVAAVNDPGKSPGLPQSDAVDAPAVASPDRASENPAAEAEMSPSGGTASVGRSPKEGPSLKNPHKPASTPTDDGPTSSGGSVSTDESPDSGFRLPAPQTSEEQPGRPPPGNSEAPPAAELTQDDDPESDVGEPPSESPGPGQPQSDRHPVPPGSAQKTILAQVNQVFSIGEARQPAEKLELASKLAALAEKSQQPEERFVLLRRAADLACDGGDAALMLDVVERIAGQYEVDLLHAQQVMLLRFAAAASGKEQIAGLVAASESVVDQLVADQRIELADELSAAVYRATKKRGNTDVRKAALARRREVLHLRDLLKQIEEARAALANNPDDAEAHATLGRWYAFKLGDWEEGLRQLAKGDDPTLKRLAEQDLALPKKALAQIALADSWWEAAEKTTDDTKRSLLSRAAYWYRQAQPELTSVIAKAKVARRLEEIGAATGPPPAVAPFDAKEAKDHQLRWARHLKVPVEWENSIDMKFVLIPPGEYLMGSTEEEVAQLTEEGKVSRSYMRRLPSEAPQHRVRITQPFWLGATEVTQAQYQRIMGSNPSKFQGEGQRPVEQVSWNDCVDFCRRLSELPKEKATKRHYGLPTEAQWEYACRAGNPGRRWFSEQPKPLPKAVEEKLLGQCAWFQVNAGGKTHPVGQLRPNPWGLHDVYGNVWEWCQDWCGNGYYVKSPTDDPPGPEAGCLSRVSRGGGWGVSPGGCRSAHRYWCAPGRRGHHVGFRLACSLVDAS